MPESSTNRVGVFTPPAAGGYWGIWHSQPSGVPGEANYSGGLGTYPQQHMPIAVHSAAAGRAGQTFFTYGGAAGPTRSLNHLQVMVGVFDHATATFLRPRILLDKPDAGTNPHENATIQMDEAGHIWVFANQHGPQSYRDNKAYILRSTRPLDVTEFEVVSRELFSYAQPWVVPDQGMLLLHTRYTDDWKRELWMRRCEDGRNWTASEPLTRITSGGHYQMSARFGRRVATVFDKHPEGDITRRTNLHYLETDDLGRTWRTIDGRAMKVPFTAPEDAAAALVHDYESQGLRVYFKDLAFNAAGRPVILYLVSPTHRQGIEAGLRRWKTARWTGDRWSIRDLTTSSHNYDHGSLFIDSLPNDAEQWRVLAPTAEGPQAEGTGGRLELWESDDQGENWQRVAAPTPAPRYNQTYVRPVHGGCDDFFALWADGDPFAYSPSCLYFTDRGMRQVWQMPTAFEGDAAPGRLIRFTPERERPLSRQQPGVPAGARGSLVGEGAGL